jgi:hypothetical protein
MTRPLAAAILALSLSVSHAQTTLRITNVTISEKEHTKNGTNITVDLKKDEGSDRTVIYADQDFTIKGWVKVSTHNVKRSSIKNSAVNAIFELDLYANGKKDGRRVEKIFYGEDERKTHIKETFSIKSGINMRMITVQYDAQVE